MAYTFTTPNGIALQAVVTKLAAQIAATPTSQQGLLSSLQQQLNLLQMELVYYAMVYEPLTMSAANILTVM